MNAVALFIDTVCSEDICQDFHCPLEHITFGLAWIENWEKWFAWIEI